ncbi:MAG TPA: EAL domain-containing protein [Beijerinckiaceae bacterium]|nr:EAL domain-containing protein [Beijerinckiaceae bacterium]
MSRHAGLHPEKSLDRESYALLVASLFTSPTSIILSNVVGVFVPLMCWLTTNLNVFLAYSVATAIIVLLRILTVSRYLRADHSRDSMKDIARWDREYFLGATIYSIVLGLNCCTALIASQEPASHLVTVISAIAFSSGYVSRNAGRPYFVIIQLLCFGLPMAIGLFCAENHYYNAIGYFILLYIVTNIAITFSVNRNLLALAKANKVSEVLASTLKSKNITLDAALNNMTHGLAMFDARLMLAICNAKFDELYRLPDNFKASDTPLAGFIERLIEYHFLAPNLADELSSTCRRVLESQTPAVCELRTESGLIFVVSLEPTSEGGILMLTEDATARKATEAQIERMAHFDELTGLANRFQFSKALKAACARLRRQASEFCVLYVDLDNFKQINDNYGHDAGDALLKSATERMVTLVDDGDLLARFGGDEFVLMHEKDLASAIAIGQEIIDAMSIPFEILGKSVHVTASVGIASAPNHGAEPADLLRHADMALYTAKGAGRNRLTIFAPEMATAMSDRHALEEDLREACQSNALMLFYQPIIDLKTGEFTSCEALMRWRHPTRGMVPPSTFIPVAEQTGLIAKLGDWAIRKACEDASSWPEGVSVAVNVSPLQFRDPARLINTVKDALLMSRLEPKRLQLEVTESLLIEDQKSTLEAIRELRRVGVKFSLDDFGTGYSSLAYLSAYPFSMVKIDRSFAQNVTTDNNSKSIVEAVCGLAKRLGMLVVVEGIETEDQREAIRAMGADKAQGYFFGRPEPATTLVPRLQKAA